MDRDLGHDIQQQQRDEDIKILFEDEGKKLEQLWEAYSKK